MKALKILTHPILLISCFLLLLISGQHIGGFYLLYLLLALPHGGLHAVVAVAGLILLVSSWLKFKRQNKFIIEAIINLCGAGCLVASLIIFFYRDTSRYNISTFEQWVPRASFLLFAILVIAFALYNILRTFSGKIPTNKLHSI